MEEEALDSRGRNLTLGIFAALVLLIAGLVFRSYSIKQGRIEAMLSSDPTRQARAVSELMGDEITNDGQVSEQLQGERPSVRMAAVRALKALALDPTTPDKRRKDAARVTVPFLKDSDQPIKDEASEALTDMGPDIAMEAVTSALNDGDGTVKSGAQGVCQNLAPASIAPLLEFTGDNGATARLRTPHRSSAGNALVEIAKKNPDYKTVILLGQRAVNAQGAAAYFPLQRLLHLDRALIVAKPGDPIYGVVDYLDPTRDTEDDQNNAISILDRIGDNRAVPFLLSRVDPPQTRRAAVGALGRIADKRATPQLLRYLPTDEMNRLEIVIALGKIADPIAAPPLIQYGLGSVSDTVRAAAADSLRSIGLPARDLLIAAARETTAPPDDPGFYRAEGATQALAGLRDPTSTQVAVASLKHPAANVREAAAASLGDSGDPSVVAPLIASFTDSDGRVAGAAARSLSAFGKKAVAPLVAALSDPRRVYWASLAIRYIGPSAVPALEQKLTAGDPAGSLAAAVLLGDLGDVRALGALRQAAARSSNADFKFAADSSIERLSGGLGVQPGEKAGKTG